MNEYMTSEETDKASADVKAQEERDNMAAEAKKKADEKTPSM
jgi:hypothetical protein